MKKIILLILIIFIYSNLGVKTSAEVSGVRLPILLYHNVTKSYPNEDFDLHIDQSTLESHFKTLKENHYTPITFEEYYNYRVNGYTLPENPIIITFDDGYLSNYELAYPLIKKYDLKATIFIITSSAYSPNLHAYPHFNWKQALEMQNSGAVIIESHSYSHLIHTEISTRTLINEVRKSYYDIFINTLRNPFTYAYPTGKFTLESQNAVSRAGYKIQVTVMGGVNDDSIPLNELRRINVSGNMTSEDLLNLMRN